MKRRILNQHVLLEFSAFSGLIGGFLGFIVPNFPMSDFFAVSVFVTTYHLFSGYVSSLVRAKASESVKKLLSLQPLTARVIREGKEEEISIEEVKIDDLVIVRPGERIPVDGIVTDGASSVDQSLVTGEPISVKKAVNEQVIGG